MTKRRPLGLLATAACLSTLLVGVDTTPALAQAIDTQTQCFSTPVPSGWIQIDFLHSVPAEGTCGAVGQPSVPNFQVIGRHDNIEDDAIIEFCQGAPVPLGWVVIGNRWDSTRCGRPTTSVRNVATMWLPPPASSDGITVCTSSLVPPDWVIQDYRNGRPDPCGPGVVNLPFLVRHSHRPVGAQLQVCAGQLPAGWQLVQRLTSTTQCRPTTAPPSNNVAVIRKVDAEPWDIDYVMLGDSISSGQGSPPYTVGDQGDGRTARTCRRSTRSWTWGTATEIARRRTVTAVTRACGGSTTAGVLTDQLGALSQATDLVTITVGANDVGFEQKLRQCINPFSSCKDIVLSEPERVALTNSLRTTYREIKARVRPNTRILVLAYPKFFPLSKVGGCPDYFDNDELAAIDRFWDRLHEVIQGAANAERVTYVGETLFSFDGHRLCFDVDGVTQVYANGLILLGRPMEASFHPNPFGDQRLVEVLRTKGYLNVQTWSQ